MTRIVIQLVRDSGDGRWHLEHAGRDLGGYEGKAQAVHDGERRIEEFQAKGFEASLVEVDGEGIIEQEDDYALGAPRSSG